MSNEELNKKIEFIVEQQVKFAAEIEITREVQAADAKLVKEQHRILSDAVLTVVGLVGSLTRAQLAADDRINELTDSQARTDDRINALVDGQTRTDESIKLLMESQKRTDERLNVFINVVERHISGNGGSENHA